MQKEKLMDILKSALRFEFQFLLFLLSVVVVSALFSKIIYSTYFKFFGSKGIWLSGWLGVSVHELSHALLCLVFRHKITKISLFKPGKDPNAGFVMHTFNQKSLYQTLGNFFISFAPVFIAPLLAALLYYWLVSINLPHSNLLQSTDWLALTRLAKLFYAQLCSAGYPAIIWLYLAACLSAHMNLSPEDLQVSLKGGVIFLVLLYPLLVILLFFDRLSIPHYLAGLAELWLSFFILLLLVIFLISMTLWLVRPVYLLMN